MSACLWAIRPANALLYLNDVDRYIKEKLRIRHYVRYMDDMILLVREKSKARECITEVKVLLND